MEFQVGDKVMLKVSPWKGVVRFGKRGKLNPRYVGPFKVLKKVGAVAYKLELPQELSRLQFVEEPIEITDREVKQLRRSRVPIVKVRWNSRRGPEFTWEREDQFRKKYPHLFTKTAPSSSAIPSPTPNSPTHIEIPESCLPLRKRVRFASPIPSREVGEEFRRGSLDYDITIHGFNLVGAIDEIAPNHRRGVNSVGGRKFNELYRDRHVHRRLAVMIEREAKMAREAWGLSMDASDYARSDVMSLRTTVVAQSALISELQSADHSFLFFYSSDFEPNAPIIDIL
ncbi:hypothetical protein Tco_1355448 [Tanacetum coccineum]